MNKLHYFILRIALVFIVSTQAFVVSAAEKLMWEYVDQVSKAFVTDSIQTNDGNFLTAVTNAKFDIPPRRFYSKLVKVDPSGKAVLSFGRSGTQSITALQRLADVSHIAEDQAGAIYVSGILRSVSGSLSSGSYAFLAKLSSNGVLDRRFGDRGFLRIRAKHGSGHVNSNIKLAIAAHGQITLSSLERTGDLQELTLSHISPEGRLLSQKRYPELKLWAIHKMAYINDKLTIAGSIFSGEVNLKNLRAFVAQWDQDGNPADFGDSGVLVSADDSAVLDVQYADNELYTLVFGSSGTKLQTITNQGHWDRVVHQFKANYYPARLIQENSQNFYIMATDYGDSGTTTIRGNDVWRIKDGAIDLSFGNQGFIRSDLVNALQWAHGWMGFTHDNALYLVGDSKKGISLVRMD